MKALKLGVVIGASVSSSFKSAIQSTDQKITKLGEAVARTNAKFKAAGDVIKYKKTLQQLKDKQAKLGGSSVKLAAGIKAVELRYRQAKSEAKSYGISIGKVVGAHERLGHSLKKLERRQKRFAGMAKAKSSLGAMRGRFLGLAGLAYGAAKIGGKAVDHEQAVVRLSTVVDKKSLAKAKDFARKYAQNNIADETTMVNIQYELNSAGLGANASMIGSAIVSKVAKVTYGSADKVASVIGIVFNNMSKSIKGNVQEKLERIGDLLTKTQLKFQITDFSQLGESFAKGAKGAVKYRVALDQTATVLGQLNTLGTTGSLAGTAFNAILRQMGKASEELGFEIKRDSDGIMDLIGTIENLKEAMVDTTDIDERAAIIQDTFGDEGGTISLLLDNLDTLKEGYKDVKNNSKGIVDENYAKFLDSTGGKMAIFGNNIKMIGSVFSEALFPAVNMVLKPLSDFAKFATDGIQNYPIMAQILGGVAVVLGSVAVAIGVATVAQLAMNAAMLLNPVTAAIGAIVIGATLIYKYWGPIKGFFVGIWNGIKNIFGRGVAFIFKIIKGITSIIPDKFLPESMSAKSLDATIKKYQFLGKTVKETKGWQSYSVAKVIQKKPEKIETTSAGRQQGDVARRAGGFETPKNIKQSIPKVAAATILATGMAVAQGPQVVNKTTKSTTITAPITINGAENPEKIGESVKISLQQLDQSDSQLDEEDE